MQPLVVIDVVGLSMRQVGVRTPNLVRLARDVPHHLRKVEIGCR